jgi:hypothetical protein
MPQIEMISVWMCLYCNKSNDHTNPVRCWNCNKRKPTLKQAKKIITKRKRDIIKKNNQTRKDTISKLDILPTESIQDLQFDTSELK